MNNEFYSIDLFSGCGGLSEGLKLAGFKTLLAVEIEPIAVEAYKMNHPDTQVMDEDIRSISAEKIRAALNGKRLHLLAGCPPCQGFSSIRRLNRPDHCPDDRNDLIDEYLRLVRELKPLTIMMENVPALKNYDKFKAVCDELRRIGYTLDIDVIEISNYGVPQKRKRLVLLGSLLESDLKIDRKFNSGIRKTVRDVISGLESVEETMDSAHKRYPKHTERIMQMIRLTPKNGGSRKDLPAEFTLSCHKKENVGFHDVYGRLRWDDYSTTITGGCLNPSKGRFLHPEEDRCITAREAALLQSFPKEYRFPEDISLSALALLIGNALPPQFCYYQALKIKEHLEKHLNKLELLA